MLKEKPFCQKHLLTLADYSPDDILRVLRLAGQIKATPRDGGEPKPLAGKTLAMIFAKSSTRTRVSFEVGMYQLGGYPLYLSTQGLQLGRGETIADTAKTLSRYVDGIMIRTFKQSDVCELAREGSVPVINALTDDFHPCQALADMLTIYEEFGRFCDLKVCFVGDGNNVATSLAIICAKLGVNFSIATPIGYEIKSDKKAIIDDAAKLSGAIIEYLNVPKLAAAGANVVYTDVFTSMGQEDTARERKAAFEGFAVNSELMACACDDAIFLHCLPAHRGEEVAAEVIDGAQSRVFDQAENRLHAQKAVMVLLMGDKNGSN